MSYLYQDEFAAKLAGAGSDDAVYDEEEDDPLVPDEDSENDEFGDEDEEDSDQKNEES